MSVNLIMSLFHELLDLVQSPIKDEVEGFVFVTVGVVYICFRGPKLGCF